MLDNLIKNLNSDKDECDLCAEKGSAVECSNCYRNKIIETAPQLNEAINKIYKNNEINKYVLLVNKYYDGILDFIKLHNIDCYVKNGLCDEWVCTIITKEGFLSLDREGFELIKI